MTTITTSDTARTALYTKVNTMVSECVKNTGDETIAGTKTFSSSPVVPTPAVSDNSTKVVTTAYINAKFVVVNEEDLPSVRDTDVFYFVREE